jgi:hypothetical protein
METPENLVKIPFEKTIPNVSWYRHQKWPPGQYKRFRHVHTMSQNIADFEFFNNANDIEDLRLAGKLDPAYSIP